MVKSKIKVNTSQVSSELGTKAKVKRQRYTLQSGLRPERSLILKHDERGVVKRTRSGISDQPQVAGRDGMFLSLSLTLSHVKYSLLAMANFA